MAVRPELFARYDYLYDLFKDVHDRLQAPCERLAQRLAVFVSKL